jgi:hypothetical protein
MNLLPGSPGSRSTPREIPMRAGGRLNDNCLLLLVYSMTSVFMCNSVVKFVFLSYFPQFLLQAERVCPIIST